LIPWYPCRWCFTLTDRLMPARELQSKEWRVLYTNSSENLLLVRFTFLTKNVHIAYHTSQGQLTVFCWIFNYLKFKKKQQSQWGCFF
jgi:hypothetical protein